MHPTYSILPCPLSEYLLSKFPRDQLIAKKDAWWHFLAKLCEIGWFNHCPKGIVGPLNGSPNRLSYGVFRSAKMSRTFRRWQEHSMETDHHLSSSPDCSNTADVPSFILRTALSAIPFVSDRWGVEVPWFHDNSSHAPPNSIELSVFIYNIRCLQRLQEFG